MCYIVIYTVLGNEVQDIILSQKKMVEVIENCSSSELIQKSDFMTEVGENYSLLYTVIPSEKCLMIMHDLLFVALTVQVVARITAQVLPSTGLEYCICLGSFFSYSNLQSFYGMHLA